MDKDTLFSSFGKWVAPIFVEKFQEHIRKSGQDKYTKKLTTTAYTLLLLHAHLESREGLRAIAADALNEDFHEILGFTSISASQLSRKHNQVDPAILATLFAELVQQHTSGPRFAKQKPASSFTFAWCLWARRMSCRKR